MKKVTAMVMVAGLCLLAAGAVLAAEEAAGATKFNHYALFAAALGIAIAAFGGAFGQGRTASAALEGIARNPNAADKMFVPMVLGLVLIESLVIYALVVELLILFLGR